jgi:VPDSG-CTERM motif
MKTKILILLLALTCSARANFIQLGELDFTGNFTVNHLYDFNNRGAQPFGWFGTMTVNQVTGMFGQYVQSGYVLSMLNNAVWTVPSGYPTWTIGGYTLTITFLGIYAAGFCVGVVDLSGNGFDPNNYPPYGAYSHWEFWSPAWPPNITEDFTGPIELRFIVGYDNRHVPDSGSALVIFGAGLVGLLGWKRTFA